MTVGEIARRQILKNRDKNQVQTILDFCCKRSKKYLDFICIKS